MRVPATAVDDDHADGDLDQDHARRRGLLGAGGDGKGEDPVGDGLPSPQARTRTVEASGRDVVSDPRAEKAVRDVRPGDRRDADVRSNVTDVPLDPCSSSRAAPSAGPEPCPRV